MGRGVNDSSTKLSIDVGFEKTVVVSYEAAIDLRSE